MTLIDEKATTEKIKVAIEALRAKATKDDLLVFYYTGHVVNVGKERNVSKVIFPTDGDFENARYLKISEVIESMNSIGAKNALVVIDG